MSRPANIIEAISKPEYFGRAFKDLSTFSAWMTFLRTVYGLPFQSEEELATFQECTKRETPLVGGHKEIYCVCGRRGGKSRLMATIAAFEALWGGWADGLAPGENAFIFLIAFDKVQAKQLFNYVRGLLEPFMTKEEKKNRITSDTIELKEQRTTIMVKAGMFQAVRGFSTAVVLLDELGFARSETSAQPVDELVAALTPSIMENGLLIGASTPFIASGYFYDQYDSHFGKQDDEVLCWHGGTLRMNPTYSEKKITRDIKKDRIRYESEYNATFRSDIESFLPKFMIEAAMKVDETMPETGRRYECFVDASGGRSDSYCMAIGYREGETAVVARLVEQQAPFDDPGEVTEKFATVAKQYGIKRIIADRYAGNWVSSAWEKRGIIVERSVLSASDLYLELQALISMERVALVRNDRLLVQLQQLERRALPGGRDVVSHPDGTHDDLANCIAGLTVNLLPHRLWTVENMPLPIVGPHGADKVMTPSMVSGRRRAEIRLEAEAELAAFMREGGGSTIIRRQGV